VASWAVKAKLFSWSASSTLVMNCMYASATVSRSSRRPSRQWLKTARPAAGRGPRRLRPDRLPAPAAPTPRVRRLVEGLEQGTPQTSHALPGSVLVGAARERGVDERRDCIACRDLQRFLGHGGTFRSRDRSVGFIKVRRRPARFSGQRCRRAPVRELAGTRATRLRSLRRTLRRRGHRTCAERS